MPDISMCNSVTCPAKQNCYRNPLSGTVPNPLRQSWVLIPENKEFPDKCGLYWQIYKGNNNDCI